MSYTYDEQCIGVYPDAFTRRYFSAAYTECMHYGAQVVVKRKYEGKGRDICLCYKCEKFNDTAGCSIANELYKFCVKHDISTPVLMCPGFKLQCQVTNKSE